MSFFDKFKARSSEATPAPDNDETRLRNLEKRLKELEDWQNRWIPADRELASKLEEQIKELKQKLGK